MRITRELLSPSREDAVRLKRSEKMGMIVLAYACTILEDLKTELADRLGMIEGGPQALKTLSDDADGLLNELRKTVPENQRQNLQNTATDYEIRLTPKVTPYSTSVVMQKSEFKELVDFARAKCHDCTEDDRTCEKCALYQLLTVLLPLEDYHDSLLCPYNLGEWVN